MITGRSSGPLLMVSALYGDEPMAAIFEERATIAAWLRVEAALAAVQADLGVIEREAAEALDRVLVVDNVDVELLWRDTKVVGYPILPLIRQITPLLPPEHAGRLHFGTTTQDVMDTALALQLRAATARVHELLELWGDALAQATERHAGTVMAARTHNQQAVPTTLGAKLAALLDEVGRHAERLDEFEPRVCRVSLFGAGGTAAALGPSSARVREALAKRLGLEGADVSWHSARDGVAEFVFAVTAAAQSAARFGREVANLSRTEIGELGEPVGHHRGASSTMPQKVNPVTSEAILGLAGVARGCLAPMAAAMIVEHERAAGEWHVEWDVVPRAAVAGAGAVALAAELTAHLRVDPTAMRRNLDLDLGLVMAEAYMIRLALPMGQARAHDAVYAAVTEARRGGRPLVEVLRDHVSDDVWSAIAVGDGLDPEDYIGEAPSMARRAVERWRHRRLEVPS